MGTTVKYQQGDVILLKVTEEEFQAHLKENSHHNKEETLFGARKGLAVIALGEATGHKHAVNMKDMLKEVGITMYRPQWKETDVNAPIAIDIAGGSVMIDHEEHHSIEVPEGKYICRIVREFDHITGRSMNVAD